MPHTTLTEHIADWHTDLSVDPGRRIVHNVALTGTVSKNGYRYAEQALREAAALYEHKPVFLDHARDRAQPHERSTRDLVGTIVNSRYASGRIRGDIRVLDTESGRTFLALAESNAPDVGMSHVVLAERTAADGSVERIRDVVSVDAVVFPATTRTFRESSRHNGAGAKSATTPVDVESTDLQQRVEELVCERDVLREQLQSIRDRQQIEQAERRLQQELDRAQLPASARTELFLRQLRESNAADRAALITERLALIAAARRQPPLSSERTTRTQPDETATFVAAIKRNAS